jgi:polyhydroxybutyrate depolymerase
MLTTKGRRGVLIAALVLLVVSLCAVAAGTYWAVGPALRCGRPATGPARPGWSARRVVSGGLERCYYLYVPGGDGPAQPAPLVVTFHGFLSNPNSHEAISGWRELADEEGFWVVYPQGTQFPQRWNAGPTWGGSEVDDVQFFLDLLDDLDQVADIDRTRVYVNGFSNGGGMTVRLGCELSDRVTALGTVAAAVVERADCDRVRAVPAIVSYEGGTMQGRALPRAAGITNAPTYFVGAEEWVAAWAQGNGCDPTPEAMPAQGKVRGVRYVGCDDRADVILYTIEGGGHTWPGGRPIPLVGTTSRDVEATREMWRFFQRYRLDG